jgi:acetyl esterase/lipase
VLLWIHGGGYLVGTAKQDDLICARFAKRLGVTVVSVDYRLAPEHPFPGPLEDCFAAFELIHREAALLGIDPERVVIGGMSAGGGLAAALALRIHDRERPAPRLQLLVYPMVDDRTVLREIDSRNHRVWNPASNRLGWTSYLGRAPGSPSIEDHAAPARRQDFSGLPPAWIGVGTCDLFHDEDVAYAQKLRDAGVPVDLEIVPGAFHGFDAVLPDKPVSRRFFEAQAAAIEKALAR